MTENNTAPAMGAEELAELVHLEAAATPAPWKWADGQSRDGDSIEMLVSSEWKPGESAADWQVFWGSEIGDSKQSSNWALACDARNALPRLLDELAALRAQLLTAQIRAGEAEAQRDELQLELQALTPECTCYEFIGGHQQGCPMYSRPNWREKCEEAEAQRDLAVGALKPFAAVVEKYKDDRDVRFTGIIELTLELYPPSSRCRFGLGSVPSTVFTDASAALAALPSGSAEPLRKCVAAADVMRMNMGKVDGYDAARAELDRVGKVE